MKLLAILLTILIFRPMVWDDSVIAGLKALAPTPVYPTTTYDPISTLNAGKEVLQVPPTSVVWLDHNNAALSGPTILIQTEHQVTSHLAAAEIGDLVIKLHPHGTQALWSTGQYWWRINSTWAIKGPPLSTYSSSSQLARVSCKSTPFIIVTCALKWLLYPHSIINAPSYAGLVWSIPFQPQQHRFPADLVTRVAIDGRLFNVVLHGVSNYHPRAPHIVRGFNVPWEVIEKSGEVNATAIVHRAAPTPATNAQTIANFESETSAPLARIEDSTGIEEAQHVAQVPVVNSPPPSRCASPGFTFEHEAPVTEAAVGLPPNARFGASYPDTIQSFNRPLGTNQYIAWLHLTRPTQPLPNRAVPADQAAVVRSHWRPVLRGLADRAEDRHLPSRATIAAESEEGHVMAEEAGPSTVVEDQPEISTLEEGSSGNGQ